MEPTHVTNLRLTDTGHALCVAAAGQPFDAWTRDRILDAAQGGVTIGAWDRAPGCERWYGPSTGSFVSRSTWPTMWCCR